MNSMKFIKKIFTKSQEDISPEEQEKLNSMLNENDVREEDIYIDSENEYIYHEEDEIKPSVNENEVEDIEEIDLEEIVKKIKPDQINKLRNLLDKKEEEIEKKNPSIQTINKEKEETIETHEHDEEKEKFEQENETDAIGELKTQEIENIKDEHEIAEESEENKLVEEEKEEYLELEGENNNNETFTQNEIIADEMKALFSKENIFVKTTRNSEHEVLDGKTLTQINVFDNFSDMNTSVSEQNSWFVSNIKKLSELKNFKILKSEEGVKDLVWEKDEPVMICFRANNVVNNIEEF